MIALWVIPSKFLFLTQDVVSYYYLFSISIVYSIFLKIDALFFSFFYRFFSSWVSIENETHEYPSGTGKSINFFTNTKQVLGSQDSQVKLSNTLDFKYETSKDWLLSSFFYYKVLNSLNLLDNAPSISHNKGEEFLGSITALGDYSTILTQILFLDSKFKFDPVDLNRSYLTAKHPRYILNSKTFETVTVKTSPINTNLFNKLNLSNQRIFESILNKNVNFGKQQRWLSKNNLLSDKVVLKPLSWTFLKKLIGNPVFDIGSSERNIWFSNKISKISNFKKLNDVLNCSEDNKLLITPFSMNKNNSLNLENFENSLFWISKRYKFMQGLNTNQQEFAFIKNNEVHIDVTPDTKNNNSLLINSLTSGYYLSQAGLVIEHRAFKNLNSKIGSSIIESLMVGANYDIFSSVDSEFITFLTNNNTLNSNKVYFFSHI